MRSVPVPILAFMFAVCAYMLLGQKPEGSTEEQRVFSEEYPIRDSVALSPDVLRALLQDKTVKLGFESATTLQRQHPEQLFRAAKVRLGPPNEIDLVVSGIYPMSGADNDWFWIVRSVAQDPKVLLTVGGNSVTLLDSRTHGYRDLRIAWSAASGYSVEKVYHFDGEKYRVWKKKEYENSR